jgi:alpha-galactosidase
MLAQKTVMALAAAAAVDASKALMPTPPMGFNNWARFECALNQTVFTATADAMVSNGLLAAGYDRVNIDDCWPLHERAANGSLQWNPVLFPDGLIWLGEYLKERNLKFGIYSDAGNATCGGYPGSLNYEEQDAATFASWGIDYSSWMAATSTIKALSMTSKPTRRSTATGTACSPTCPSL